MGAAIWMPYVTVYGMVQEIVRVRPGDHVVITSAANSIGMAALQVVRHLGAVPIATTATADQREALLDAGAAAVIVTADAPDLAAVIRAATGGKGADLVLDADGGPQVEDLVRACAPGAALIVHGGLSGLPTPLPAGGRSPAWMRRYHVFEITTDPAALHRAEQFVQAGLAIGAFAPVIDRVFDFDDVVAAHRYVDSPDRRPGKPVLRVRP